MHNEMFKKSLLVSISAILVSVYLSGCSQLKQFTQPKKVDKKVEKKATKVLPANLRFSSESIKTDMEETKEVNPYDYTITMDNLEKSSAYIILYNRGQGVLNINELKFHDNSENLFALESECGKTIKAFGSCKLKITFSGKHQGRYTSVLRVDSNSDGKYVGKVGKVHIIAEAKNRMTGIIAPVNFKEYIEPKKPMVNLRFKKVNDAKYTSVKNNGIDDIELNGFELSGDAKDSFSLEHECPRVLKAGESCELKVVYTKKTAKLALAYLILDSDGVLFPSDTINLEGKPFPVAAPKDAPKELIAAAKDDMSIKITDLSVKTNEEVFLEDVSSVPSKYFFRVMYQNDVDPYFKDYYERLLKYYFEKNRFKITKDAGAANKILNIYPNVSISASEDGRMLVKSNIKVNIVTKSTGDKKIASDKLEFNMSIMASDYANKYVVYVVASSKLNLFMFNLLGIEQ